MLMRLRLRERNADTGASAEPQKLGVEGVGTEARVVGVGGGRGGDAAAAVSGS